MTRELGMRGKKEEIKLTVRNRPTEILESGSADRELLVDAMESARPENTIHSPMIYCYGPNYLPHNST